MTAPSKRVPLEDVPVGCRVRVWRRDHEDVDGIVGVAERAEFERLKKKFT
jgi:hypothetical protein